MSRNNSRLRNIEKQFRVKKNKGFDQIALIDGWRFGLFNYYKDADMYVFLHEWRIYMSRELDRARKEGKFNEIKRELEKLEQKIRSGGGFMEILFPAIAGSLIGFNLIFWFRKVADRSP